MLNVDNAVVLCSAKLPFCRLSCRTQHTEVPFRCEWGEKARCEEGTFTHVSFLGGNNNANVLCEFLKCLHVYYYSSRIEVLARVSIIDTYLLMLNENEPIPSSSRSPSVASNDEFSFFPCFSYWSVLHSSECAEFHVDSWEDDKMVQTYVALVCIPLTSFKDFKVFLFHLSWVQLSHLSAAAGMFQCSCGENGRKYVFSLSYTEWYRPHVTLILRLVISFFLICEYYLWQRERNSYVEFRIPQWEKKLQLQPTFLFVFELATLVQSKILRSSSSKPYKKSLKLKSKKRAEKKKFKFQSISSLFRLSSIWTQWETLSKLG